MLTSTGDNQQFSQLAKKKLIYADRIIRIIVFKCHTCVIHTECLYLKYSLGVVSVSAGYMSHIVLLTSMWIDSLYGKVQQKLYESKY